MMSMPLLWGEAYFGAGKNHESIYYISLSTGIGGAYIYHHRIISGNNGYAGESAI